jgi:hypothetical protein
MTVIEALKTEKNILFPRSLKVLSSLDVGTWYIAPHTAMDRRYFMTSILPCLSEDDFLSEDWYVEDTKQAA